MVADLLRFHVSPAEIALRGTAVYWFLFLLFRFVLRRGVGSLAITDILLLVLIADASQNAMAGGYDTVAEGALLVATLAGWNFALDWASFRWRWARRLVEPGAMPLVRDGRPLREQLRRELMTMDELRAKLRQQGIADLREVKLAAMEADGEISVIRREPDAPAPPPNRRIL